MAHSLRALDSFEEVVKGVRRTGIIAAVVYSVAATAAFAQGPSTEARLELPVTPMDNFAQFAHNSPVLAADPKDERVVALAGRLDNPDFSCSLHISGDKGTTWLPAPIVTSLPKGAEKCYAPEVAFDAEGKLNYLFLGLSGLGNNPTGAYLVKSTDQGYTRPRQVLGPERYMVRMAIDPTMGENGRLHLVWLQAGADPPTGGLAAADNPLMAAYSDDGGKTFSNPVRVSDPNRPLAVAPSLALGKDHSVHVLYYDLKEDSRDYQGLEGPVWEGNWSLVSSSSTDGGQSFSPGVEVDGGLVPPERVMLIYTMPPPALTADQKGNLFASWHDARNGDWDVFLSRSGDGGKGWSAPKRLNDDGLKNGRHQNMSRLSVSPEGRLDAIFYDRRDDAANQQANVYFTSSDDGGRTFSANTRITREPSNTMVGPRYPIPSAAGLVEFGSRISLFSKPQGALAAWTDTRNSFSDGFQQEIYSTTIHLGGEIRAKGWMQPAVIGGFGALTIVALALVKRRKGASQKIRVASTPLGGKK